MSVSRVVGDGELAEIRKRLYVEGGKLFWVGGKEVAKNQREGTRKIFWLDGKTYVVHRVVYFLHYGVWPSGVVDHIDGNPQNNLPANLRDITQAENTRSYGPAHRDSTSSYRGVHWFKRDKCWQAQIMYDGKRKHLGYFGCEKEAALVWNLAAMDLGFNKEAFNIVF